MKIDEKGLRISNPCSAIARLIMALIVANERLTDATFKPLAMSKSRNCPASVVLYSVTTLSPHMSITVPAFRKAPDGMSLPYLCP